MEILIKICAVMAVILGIVAGILKASDHRDAVLWCGFGVAVLAVLGLFLFIQDQWWKKDRKIAEANVSNTEKMIRAVNSELDDKIRRVVLRFWLNEPMPFEAIRPIQGEMRINPATASLFDGVILRFSDADSQNLPLPNMPEKPLPCYRVALFRKDEVLHRHAFALSDGDIPRIGLPVPLWVSPDGPFKTIRDLHRSTVSFSISSHLTSSIQRIELIANGWSVFKKDTSESTWRTDNGLSTLLSALATSESPPSATFQLLIRDQLLSYDEKMAGPVPVSDSAAAFFYGKVSIPRIEDQKKSAEQGDGGDAVNPSP